MKISTRQVDGITVIDARGRITLGDGDALLRETISELLATNHRELLLNLAEVSYIDSSQYRGAITFSSFRSSELSQPI